MFQRNASVHPKQLLEGVELRTLVWGDKTLLTQFNLQPGSTIPVHQHPYEQTGYLVTGRMRLSVGEEQFEAEPGDSWCIPENIPHGAMPHEACVVVEVFSPVREDYLPG